MDKQAVFSSAEVKEISVVGVSEDVVVVPAAGNQVTISYYEGENDSWSVACSEDGKLEIARIDQRKWYQHIVFFTAPQPLTIEIPADFTPEIVQIKTVSGDISLRDVSAGTLSVSSVSGDVSCRQLTLNASCSVLTTSGEMNLTDCTTEKNLEMTTTSGDIELDRITVGGEIALKSVSGDMELETISALSAKIKTVSGDVELTLAENACEYALQIKTVSGDVRSEGSYTGSRPLEITTTSGDIHIEAAGGKNF